jgi:hypothetical protein
MQSAGADAVWTVGSQLSSIKADGDNVYILWQNNSPDKNIYFRKSADNGNSFGDVVRISGIDSGPQSSSGFASNALMAVPIETAGSSENDGGTDSRYIYVAWMNVDPGTSHSKVLFRSSSDGGSTFGEPLRLTDGDFEGDSDIVQLFASGNNVYAVLLNEWTDEDDPDSYYYDVIMRVSTDNGKTFGKPIRLVPDLPTRNVRADLSVGISPFGDNQHDAVYVAWVDYGSCTVQQVTCDQIRIFFRRSTDSGETFSSPIQIERPKQVFDQDKALRSPVPMDLQVAGSADGRNVYVVWSEYIIKEQRQHIFLARSNDGGMSFGDPIRLDAGGSSQSPRLIVPARCQDYDAPNNTTKNGSGTVYVAWMYHPDNSESLTGDDAPGIILLKSSDGGNNFGQPIVVSRGITSDSWDIAVAASPTTTATPDGDRVYITWHNRTQNTSGLPEGNDIYFRSIVSGGGGGGGDEKYGDVLDLSDDVALKALLAAQNKALSFVAPQIAISPEGSHVYVAWQASYPDSSEIYLSVSADGGQSFGRIVSLNSQTDDPISKFAAAGSSGPFFGQILTPFGLAISGAGFAAAGAVALLIFRRRKRK